MRACVRGRGKGETIQIGGFPVKTQGRNALPAGVNPAVLMAELARLKADAKRIIDARTSFRSFISEFAPANQQPDPHHMVLVDALQDVADGKIHRLIVMQPPGTAKSRYASQLFPAFALSRAGRKVIAASYGAERTEANGRDVRRYVMDPKYRELTDGVMSAESSAMHRFEVVHPGGVRSEYYAASSGSAITGFRGQIALIDDPVKGWEEADSQKARDTVWNWYLSEFRSREDAEELGSQMAIAIIMTRWGVDDLVGRILPQGYRGESGWVKARDGEMWFVIRLPAQADRDDDPVGRRPGQWLWPEKKTIQWWLQTKTSLSVNVRIWAGLYQQLPVSATGGIIQRDWIKLWPADKPLPVLQFVIQSYDTAFSERTTAAESAGTDWGVAFIDDTSADGKRKQKAIVILLDCWAQHLNYPDLRKRARDRFDDMRYGAPPLTHAQKPAMFGPTSHRVFALEGRKADVVLIEEKATGGPLLHDLHGYGVPVRAHNPGRASKETRLHAVSQIFQGGFVYVPESKSPERKGMPRDWAERWVNEITSAGPGAIHWDLTDSTTQALAMVRDQGWLNIRKPPVDPLTKDRLDPDDVRRVKRRTEGNVYAA